MYTAKGRLDVDSMLKQYSPLVRRLVREQLRDVLGDAAALPMTPTTIDRRAMNSARH